MIVLGRRRGFLRVPARGLEVRQEAVVKEAAHRSTSLGARTDNRSRQWKVGAREVRDRTRQRLAGHLATGAAGPLTLRKRLVTPV
ncbi:hypothetical protein TNCT1_05750 [Streptomyces sp. 1-11]|nr:hypothetical protein TNCT1_05750 [Streptomyces sp. 1-11]